MRSLTKSNQYCDKENKNIYQSKRTLCEIGSWRCFVPNIDPKWHILLWSRWNKLTANSENVARKMDPGVRFHLFDPLFDHLPFQLQDSLKCQQCHKQFRSKAGLNYHTMAEHTIKVHYSFLFTGSSFQPNLVPTFAPKQRMRDHISSLTHWLHQSMQGHLETCASDLLRSHSWACPESAFTVFGEGCGVWSSRS